MKDIIDSWKTFLLTEGRYVKIWRAMPATTNVIRKGDYITLSRNFAVEHAVTSAIYNGEPFHIVSIQVPFEKVKEALNPGEYIYTGTDIKGRPFQISDEDGNVSLIGRRR